MVINGLRIIVTEKYATVGVMSSFIRYVVLALLRYGYALFTIRAPDVGHVGAVEAGTVGLVCTQQVIIASVVHEYTVG